MVGTTWKSSVVAVQLNANCFIAVENQEPKVYVL